MPREYDHSGDFGPGLSTGSSWSGNMASGPSGGMAQAYGTRGPDGSVSWNGIGGFGSYTGQGDYYSPPQSMPYPGGWSDPVLSQPYDTPAYTPPDITPVSYTPATELPTYQPMYDPLTSISGASMMAPEYSVFGPRVRPSTQPASQWDLAGYAGYQSSPYSNGLHPGFPGYGQMNDAYADYYNGGTYSQGSDEYDNSYSDPFNGQKGWGY